MDYDDNIITNLIFPFANGNEMCYFVPAFSGDILEVSCGNKVDRRSLPQETT